MARTRIKICGVRDEDSALAAADAGADAIGFRFDEATIARELARWDELEEVCAIIIDGTRPGEGVAFDWSLLTAHLDGISKPIILAGGLTAENVGEAIREVRPYGVDVSSGVE